MAILAMNLHGQDARATSNRDTTRESAIQTVRNQAGQLTRGRSFNRSTRPVNTAFDGLSDAQLSSFRFASSPACDR